jgi:hypothetical protein
VVEAGRDGRIRGPSPEYRRQGRSLGRKDRALSRLALWWLSVHPIGQALVVITSDNDDNIKGGIFQELIAAHEAAELAGKPFPGRITLDSKWHAGPNTQTLIAFGRKPSDRNPTGLQGFHRKYLLCILDECCGVPAELWEAAESLASNAAGGCSGCSREPNRPVFALRRGVANRAQGGKSSRSARTTPLRIPVRRYPLTFSRTWSTPNGWPPAKRVWGPKDPRYIARILGEFPKVSTDSLIEPEWPLRNERWRGTASLISGLTWPGMAIQKP